MRTLYSNIKQILQIEHIHEEKKIVKGLDMKTLPTLEHAFLLVEDGLIKDFGEMKNLPTDVAADHTIDCTGKMILPTWVDSHTHLVYSHSREHEFVDRINGLTYEEIAQRGGGILNSAKRMTEINETDLYEISKIRLDETIALGTGAIEIKSGYGLSTEGELKMLRVIQTQTLISKPVF